MLPPPTSPKNRLIRLGAYLGPLALAVALKVPLCPTAIISGMPCPGCGMTRAALALAHGDVHRACSLNPLALGVIPTVAAMVAVAIAGYLKDGDNRMHRPAAIGAGMTTIAALFVVWVLRWFGMFGGPVDV
ncbi:MAG: DUF2752 domain-containing protein [Polyangiaceae bacterium]|nr:DUF2752 domain-containing protein [Polyangiaceae bacterium]MBK8936478.1 DUF2752 domain-containing protein [Polyangiaceae bacterium]